MAFPASVATFSNYIQYASTGWDITEFYSNGETFDLTVAKTGRLYLVPILPVSGSSIPELEVWNSSGKVPGGQYTIITEGTPSNHEILVNYENGDWTACATETWTEAYFFYYGWGSLITTSGFYNKVGDTLEEVQNHLLTSGTPRLNILESGLAGTSGDLAAHISDVANPHAVTYTQVGASPSGHTHDDRYYTESETDALLLNYMPSGDYATSAELASTSGVLQSGINTKSDIGHTHDDRYYTESEVDTLLDNFSGGGTNTFDEITVSGQIMNGSGAYVTVQEMRDVFDAAIGNNAIVDGGVVTWASGLYFDVSAADYYIQGIRYTSAADQVLLASGDTNYARIDVIALNISGDASVIEGTPSANPQKPAYDPATYIETTFILVDSQATAPSGVTQTDVYMENIEWTTSLSGGTIVANETADPYAGTYHIAGTNSNVGHYIEFDYGADFDLSNVNSLSLRVKCPSAWDTKRWLRLSLWSSGVRLGSYVTLTNGSYGFDTSNTSDYQLVAIPLSDFGLSTDIADTLQIEVTGSGGPSTTVSFYIDNIKFQAGVPPVSTTQNTYLTVATDDGYNSADSPNDILYFYGANGLTTRMSGDVVTIDPSGADHGLFSGLTDDDHPQYSLADGTRPFTGAISGVTPTEDAHLATKSYVDAKNISVSGQDYLSASGQQITAALISLTSHVSGILPEANIDSAIARDSEVSSAISSHAGDASAHHSPVTLAGAYDYLTLSTQQITLNQIDLSTDVTGELADSHLSSNIPLLNATTNIFTGRIRASGISLNSTDTSARLVIKSSGATTASFFDTGIGAYETLVFGPNQNWEYQMTFGSGTSIIHLNDDPSFSYAAGDLLFNNTYGGLRITCSGVVIGINRVTMPTNTKLVVQQGILASGDSSSVDIKAQTTLTNTFARFQAMNDNNVSLNMATWGSAYGSTLFGLTRNDMASLYSTSASVFAIGSYTAEDVVIGTDDTEAIRIDTFQNVGFGTSNPSRKIHVSGNTNSSTFGMMVQNDNSDIDARAIISVASVGGALNMMACSSGYTEVLSWTNRGVIGTDSGLSGLIVYTNSGDDIRFELGGAGTADITMTSDGKLGVGVTSVGASYKIETDGAVNIGTHLYVNGTIRIYQNGTIAGNQISSASGFYCYTTSYLQSIIVNPSGIDADSYFMDDAAEYMLYMDASAGNVGVGTNTPGQKLTVMGEVGASGTVAMYNSWTNSTGGVSGWTAYNNNGNYLVAYNFGSAFSGQYMSLNRANTHCILSYNATMFMILTYTSQPMVFGTHNIEAARFDTSQRFLIGTKTANTAKLCIDQSSATGTMAVLSLDQGAADQPFIELIGAYGSDPLTHGSFTIANGDGAVVGPQAPGISDGYSFLGMFYIKGVISGYGTINGYVPIYQAEGAGL